MSLVVCHSHWLALQEPVGTYSDINKNTHLSDTFHSKNKIMNIRISSYCSMLKILLLALLCGHGLLRQFAIVRVQNRLSVYETFTTYPSDRVI